MVIKSFHQLDDAQEEQIRELEEICNLAEKPALQSYVYLDSQANAEPDRDCFYLLYENSVLAGFLSVFAPGEEGEITAIQATAGGDFSPPCSGRLPATGGGSAPFPSSRSPPPPAFPLWSKGWALSSAFRNT